MRLCGLEIGLKKERALQFQALRVQAMTMLKSRS
jgi:hypothetical protein